MPAVDKFRQERSNVALLAIGVFKLANSGLLFGLGIGLIHWRHRDLGEAASHWINTMWVGRPYFDNLISSLSSINERTLEHVAAGSFFCSALFLVEGIGLCRRKRWAEFVTVGITASLLPVEFYELFHKPRATSIVITILNIGILWYLIVRLRLDRRRRSGSLMP